ncbi:MAG: universal stress protein [Magnetospirillum sp.]
MKNILVHVDGGERSRLRLQWAVQLARLQGARLSGIFGQLAPPQRVGVVASWPSQAYRDAEAASRQEFITAIAGLPTPQWIDANRGSSDSIGDVAANAAKYFDLTILGQSDDPTSPDIAAAVIAGSGRPALVLPAAGPLGGIGNRPLLVWDGSAASARALNEALCHLPLQSAAAMLILGASDAERTALLQAQLGSYGLEPQIEHLAVGSLPPDDLVLNRAADYATDLVVAGWSASHGPNMLNHLTVPAFLVG